MNELAAGFFQNFVKNKHVIIAVPASVLYLPTKNKTFLFCFISCFHVMIGPFKVGIIEKQGKDYLTFIAETIRTKFYDVVIKEMFSTIPVKQQIKIEFLRR